MKLAFLTSAAIMPSVSNENSSTVGLKMIPASSRLLLSLNVAGVSWMPYQMTGWLTSRCTLRRRFNISWNRRTKMQQDL